MTVMSSVNYFDIPNLTHWHYIVLCLGGFQLVCLGHVHAALE